MEEQAKILMTSEFLHRNFTSTELLMPLKGFRQFVAITYLVCNLIGFIANSWVFFVVAPLLWLGHVRVPKSILFHILALCVSDLATMCGMVLLNLEILNGTWRFGLAGCRAYLLFDSLNKFSAPAIVLLISRTCYSIICLDKGRLRQTTNNNSGVKTAFIQVMVALAIVLCLLWPLLVYSQVTEIVVRIDRHKRQELFVRKCAFLPPPNVELLFNIVVSITSYCIPFAGFLFWYASVPFFLWRRKELLSQNPSSSLSTQSHQPISIKSGITGSGGIPNSFPAPSVAVIRRVVVTVVVLAMVYLVCWTPYWLGMYAQRLFHLRMTKQTVIVMYYVHLMPYISCAAYPAIFTLFNRPIRSAHYQWRRSMQRRMNGSQLVRRVRDVLVTRTDSQRSMNRRGTTKISKSILRERPSSCEMERHQSCVLLTRKESPLAAVSF
uniref:G-protein coupled receptors family 1 profile domain-containing protein n=1 Tax=Meloidogyne incognita TaxID=6306 RepID=A0A914NIG8_MELIC